MNSKSLIRQTGLGSRGMVLTAALGLALATTSCAQEEDPGYAPADEAVEMQTPPNTLTSAEQEEGWKLLFDGQSFDGWRGLGQESVPQEHWVIEDGTLHKKASGDVPVAADGQPAAGGDLMTEDTFGDFELAFDWKISPNGNSGVKYNVSEEMSTSHAPKTAALGFEYQVLDDEGHPDAKAGVDGNRTSAGLYDLIAPAAGKPLNPVGEWNEGRIVFRGNHGEHWLNGIKVVEYDLDTPRFDSLLAASKYASIEGFADRRTGHIVLQDHNDDAWYRNIKIRELPAQ